jgi:hypothetical protein
MPDTLSIERRNGELALIATEDPRYPGSVLAVFVSETAAERYKAAARTALMVAQERGRSGV